MQAHTLHTHTHKLLRIVISKYYPHTQMRVGAHVCVCVSNTQTHTQTSMCSNADTDTYTDEHVLKTQTQT